MFNRKYIDSTCGFSIAILVFRVNFLEVPKVTKKNGSWFLPALRTSRIGSGFLSLKNPLRPKAMLHRRNGGKNPETARGDSQLGGNPIFFGGTMLVSGSVVQFPTEPWLFKFLFVFKLPERGCCKVWQRKVFREGIWWKLVRATPMSYNKKTFISCQISKLFVEIKKDSVRKLWSSNGRCIFVEEAGGNCVKPLGCVHHKNGTIQLCFLHFTSHTHTNLDMYRYTPWN